MRTLLTGKSSAVHIQFVRYLFVGGSAAVVDLFSFAVLHRMLHVHYLLAAFFAYMLGLAWNHTLSVIWIFESKHDKKTEFLMVFLIALGGLLWTELLLWLSVSVLGADAIVAKIVVLWIVLIWNFGMRKVIVFH